MYMCIFAHDLIRNRRNVHTNYKQIIDLGQGDVGAF